MNINPYAATHDALTGLPNHFLFYDRLSTAIATAERNTTRFALLLIKVNNLHPIKDRHGKIARNKLLVQIAERLTESLRGADTIGRMADDEFAVLLTHVTDKAAIMPLIWRMDKTLSKFYIVDELKLDISCSIGMSIYPDNGTNANSLIEQAMSQRDQEKEKWFAN